MRSGTPESNCPTPAIESPVIVEGVYGDSAGFEKAFSAACPRAEPAAHEDVSIKREKLKRKSWMAPFHSLVAPTVAVTQRNPALVVPNCVVMEREGTLAYRAKRRPLSRVWASIYAPGLSPYVEPLFTTPCATFLSRLHHGCYIGFLMRWLLFAMLCAVLVAPPVTAVASPAPRHHRRRRRRHYHRHRYQSHPTRARYKQIQQALADKGFLPQDEVDGFWGPKSIAAMEKFQAAKRLPNDENIDALTLIALGLGPKHKSTIPVAAATASAKKTSSADTEADAQSRQN